MGQKDCISTCHTILMQLFTCHPNWTSHITETQKLLQQTQNFSSSNRSLKTPSLNLMAVHPLREHLRQPHWGGGGELSTLLL